MPSGHVDATLSPNTNKCAQNGDMFVIAGDFVLSWAA